MTTNQIGPLVEGRDDASVTDRAAPRASARSWSGPSRATWLFLVGRFGGALAYFFPAVLAAALFLLLGPRERAGWLALLAVALAWIAYIWIIPDNWYGGGGTVGNRYFLSLLPAFLLLVPAARAGVVVAGAVLAALVFQAPILLHPLHHSLRPGNMPPGRRSRRCPRS